MSLKFKKEERVALTEGATGETAVSLRFPDLPKDAISNEPVGSRLFGRDPDMEPWAALSRPTPNSKAARDVARHDVQGMLGIDDSGAEIPFEPIHTAKCRPWRIVRMFCCWCCQWQGSRFFMTRAQYLWTFNLLCFVAHGFFTGLSLYPGWGDDTGKFDITIWRTKLVWQPGYQYEVSLIDNGMPLRIDYLCAGFFGLSALFHFLACFVGFFDRLYWLYWRQLDLAFAWWRWLEYSASGSLMAVAIAVLTGTRQAETLASIFILHVCTMAMGLFTELYSRPAMTPNGNYDFSRWEGDPERISWNDPDRMPGHEGNLKFKVWGARAQRWANYRRRMIPHVFGFVPYFSAWTIVIYNFFVQLDDLRGENEDLFARIPNWIPYAVFATFGVFSAFTFVQIWYQWQPPKQYWKTEIVYCALSATAKIVLGTLLYINVINVDARFDEAVALDA